jgi:hypothetical protein
VNARAGTGGSCSVRAAGATAAGSGDTSGNSAKLATNTNAVSSSDS